METTQEAGPGEVKARTNGIRTELIAGVTTFFTMAYIVVVNPSILSTEGTGMSFTAVLTAPIMVCFVMTLLMGLYAKLTFSITRRILWGFIPHTGLYLLSSRGPAVHPS